MATPLERASLIALIIGEAVGTFASFNPSWFTVSSPFFHEQEAHEGNVRRIRWGEVAATLVTVGVGAAMTYVVKDPAPLVASVVISAVEVLGYEYMMAHPATEDEGGGTISSNPLGRRP